MRDRQEIEQDAHVRVGSGLESEQTMRMILEVLLDIREMLQDWRDHALR